MTDHAQLQVMHSKIFALS